MLLKLKLANSLFLGLINYILTVVFVGGGEELCTVIKPFLLNHAISVKSFLGVALPFLAESKL